ncbi:MAG: hypothetical protein H0T86_12510 [Gemmatimonadales bacterium]|nr:hypothetical protein [Gemmatimonadales bacterium]
MLNPDGRLATFARAAAVAIVALGITTPAGAQFGGLKKKLKATAAPEATKPAATEDVETAEAPAGAAGTMVLTPDVLVSW